MTEPPSDAHKLVPYIDNKQSLQTVLSGLQSDIVRVDMQPLLLDTKTSDELLLEKLNIACANEMER